MTVLARGPEAPTYITFFFGQWLLNLNWALATDMLMVFKINYLLNSIIYSKKQLRHFL
jgi:hypothetical protein